MLARPSTGGSSGSNRSLPGRASEPASLVFAERDRHEPHLVAGATGSRAARAGGPTARRRAPDEMPAAGALQRVDGRQRGGDRDGACRHGGARVLPPRQHQLVRQVAHVGKARQEAHHVDVIGHGAVALDHPVRRKPGAARRPRRDRARRWRGSRRECASGRPASVGCAQSRQQRRESRFQLALRHRQRVVVDHERAKRRHQLHDAGNGRGLHPRRPAPAPARSRRGPSVSPKSTASAVSPQARILRHRLDAACYARGAVDGPADIVWSSYQ